MEQFTTEELRILCWMCEKEAARIAMDELKKGNKPSDNATRQKIISIGKKAYGEVIDRGNRKDIV